MTNKSIYKDAPPYCHYFFDLVKTDNLLAELELSKQTTLDIFELINPVKENYAYEPNKWTTKEVIRHIIDCERVYTYRALRFSRFDDTELAGFDEDKYIAQIKSINHNLADLRNEYLAVRNASISLFKAMDHDMLDFKGRANNAYFTARAIGFMTVGHNLHHCNIIKTRYDI